MSIVLHTQAGFSGEKVFRIHGEEAGETGESDNSQRLSKPEFCHK